MVVMVYEHRKSRSAHVVLAPPGMPDCYYEDTERSPAGTESPTLPGRGVSPGVAHRDLHRGVLATTASHRLRRSFGVIARLRRAQNRRGRHDAASTVRRPQTGNHRRWRELGARLVTLNSLTRALMNPRTPALLRPRLSHNAVL